MLRLFRLFTLSLAFGAGAVGARAASANDTLTSSITGGVLAVTVPISRLTLRMPAADLTAGPGGANGPHYFFFHDSRGALIVSGWFESQARFPGIEKLWSQQTAAWAQHRAPPPRNVAFSQLNGWDVILYDLATPPNLGTNTHVRASYVKDGTWIDVHLSYTSALALPEARAKLAAIFESLSVTSRP